MTDIEKYKKSCWECGNCTDKNIIFLNIKGMGDGKYSHLHMCVDDVKLLITDLEKILEVKSSNVSLRIKRSKE